MKTNKRRNKNKHGRTIIVQDGNIQKAIKKFKRLISDNQILTDYYKNRYFIKKSELKRRKKSIGKFKAKCWRQKQQQVLKEQY